MNLSAESAEGPDELAEGQLVFPGEFLGLIATQGRHLRDERVLEELMYGEQALRHPGPGLLRTH